MKSKTKIITFILLALVVVFISFLSFRKNSSNLPLEKFTDHSGYLTKMDDYIIFRGCKGDISYHTLIPTQNIDKKLVINQPTYVNIKADISNSISQVDKIEISKEEECEGNVNPTYLTNIFVALKEVSKNETLIQDGKNFTSSEAIIADCLECLLYTYEFDHYSVPELHYKNELLIKNGVIIERKSSP